LAVAIAASTQSPAPQPSTAEPLVLDASVPWWEKITVTVDDKGKQRSCHYEASYEEVGIATCDEEMAASLPSGGRSTAGLVSKLTFERRFSPGGKPDNGNLRPGDELLGKKVIFLTLDAKGAIETCEVVATAGDAPGSYGCDDLRNEQFQAEPSENSGPRQAFITVLAYGHMEQLS
jgi:hypothetical protein